MRVIDEVALPPGGKWESNDILQYSISWQVTFDFEKDKNLALVKEEEYFGLIFLKLVHILAITTRNDEPILNGKHPVSLLQ